MSNSRLAAVLVAGSLVVGPAASAQWNMRGPMRIILLVDSSAAISPMLNGFRAGLQGFLDSLPDEPEIAIVSTGGQMRIRVGPTTDQRKLRAAASTFASDGGGNAFLNSLLEADQRFLKKALDRRSVFVILTTDAGATAGDERIDSYNTWVKDFVARGGRAHAIVVQAVNTGVTTQIADNLVANTGGFYDTVLLASAIPKAMETLAGYVAADR